MKKVAVIGAGAWGTAVATVLAHNNYVVSLWTHEQDVVTSIKQDCINTLYLPNVKLSENIQPTTDLKEAFDGAQWIFEAVPVKYMRSVLETLKPHYNDQQRWVVLSKGIEQDTLLLPSQILDDVFETSVESVVLVGPSFATDVVAQQLTGVTVASKNKELVSELQSFMTTDYFVLFPSEDILGVQLCAALKNAITLGVGILDGAGYTDNTKTFFLVKSLQEMRQLVVACGGESQTVDGFAGIGDLVLTALGKQSRNLAAGKRLGAGESQEAINASQRCVPESFNTVASIVQLIETENLHLPLLKSLGMVAQGKENYKVILESLTQN
jgi:glycerol-3-phosphate dehydrogenase (NAD(P)+)